AQNDPRPRPLCAYLSYNTRHFCHGTCSAIYIRRAQLRCQQMPPADDIERHIAVTIIVAMEEASFLVTMQRIVGGIKIKYDLLRRTRVGLQEKRDKETFNRARIMCDLMVARRQRCAQLQTIERRLAGHWSAVLAHGLQFIHNYRYHGIVPKRLVIIEVLIPKRNSHHPLRNQCPHRMLNKLRAAAINKAIRKALREPDPAIGGF